jgi:hypothetical protein
MVFLKRLTIPAGLLGICLLFFLLRFPSLFEPYWYGDEGIYFTVGKALSAGRDLYTAIWDNKPPLLYWLYMAFPDLFSIRLVSLLFGLAAVIAFSFLAGKFFTNTRVVFITTLLFSIFFGLPTIEGNIANAENFMLFPIITGVLLFMHGTFPGTKEHGVSHLPWLRGKHTLFLSGLLLGIAFLFKTVAIFDFLALLTFSFFIVSAKTSGWKTRFNHLYQATHRFIGGFFLPLAVVCLLFLIQGVLPEFLNTIFLDNVSYVGVKNELLIPHGLLLMKAALLILSVSLVYFFRNRFHRKTIFILLWLIFSLFNTYFSQRPYSHYQLVLLPSLVLGFGLFLTLTDIKQKLLLGAFVIGIVFLLHHEFPHWNARKTTAYYKNFYALLSRQQSLTRYQEFFDRNTPQDYQVADYLSLHTKPDEEVFIWGNSAQVYYLSGTLPTGRYAVAYHIISPAAIEETEKAIKQKAPRFLVIMPTAEPLPFTISQYTYKLTVGDTTIYERLN